MGQPMKRAVIVGSAPFRDAARLRSFLKEDDVLVAADGGLRLLQAMGKTPSLLIGDFDSCERPTAGNVPCTVLPVKKDDTDVMAAVRRMLKDGYRDFLFLGVLGGRLDHTLANVFVLKFLSDHGAVGCLMDEAHEVRLLEAGAHCLEPREGCVFSLLPYGGAVRGVTLWDAAYSLTDATLDTSFPIGVSNRYLEKAARLSFSEGYLLYISVKEA